MAIDPRPQRHKAARSRIYDPNSSSEAQVSTTGALKTAIPEALVDGDFSGSVINSVIWTETLVGTGTNTIGLGVASMKTGAAAGGSVKIVSAKQGLFTFGESFQFATGVYASGSIAGNIRRWGVMDKTEQNGLFFELSDNTFYAVSRRAGVDTKINVEDFNHDKTFIPTTKNASYSIRYTDDRAIFQVNFLDTEDALHIMIDQEYSLIENYTLGLYFENANVANTSDVEMRVRGGSLSILGSVPLSKLENLPVEVEGLPEITFDNFGSVTNVAANTKTTILTQAYVVGAFENLVVVSASGDDYAKFYLTVNSVDIDIRRSGPDRNLIFDFTGAPYSLNPGDIVDIKVQHFHVGSLLNFDATIYGYA